MSGSSPVTPKQRSSGPRYRPGPFDDLVAGHHREDLAAPLAARLVDVRVAHAAEQDVDGDVQRARLAPLHGEGGEAASCGGGVGGGVWHGLLLGLGSGDGAVGWAEARARAACAFPARPACRGGAVQGGRSAVAFGPGPRIIVGMGIMTRPSPSAPSVGLDWLSTPPRTQSLTATRGVAARRSQEVHRLGDVSCHRNSTARVVAVRCPCVSRM